MNQSNSLTAYNKSLETNDQIIFDEIREVLKKHGALNKYGINLLHRHFEISPDEILKEYCDKENRTLTLKVVKRADLSNEKHVYTSWDLSTNLPTVGCLDHLIID